MWLSTDVVELLVLPFGGGQRDLDLDALGSSDIGMIELVFNCCKYSILHMFSLCVVDCVEGLFLCSSRTMRQILRP